MDNHSEAVESIRSQIDHLHRILVEYEPGTAEGKLKEQLQQEIEEHRRTQEILIRETNTLNSILSALQTGITIQDRDYTIIYQNAVMIRIFGDRKGEKCYEVFENNDRVCEGCPVRKAFKDGRSHTSIRKTSSVSGETVYWENTANPIRDADGEIVSCVEVCNNITERKKAEDLLQESEERFRLMMQQSPSTIELYDVDGLQIAVNKAFEVLWGFPASHTLNRFNILKSKEVERAGLLEYVKRAYAGEIVSVPEHKYDITEETEVKSRTRWLSTQIYPLKDRSGRVKNIVVTHEDVTERREAEEEIRKFKTVTDHAPYGVVMADMNGVVLYANTTLAAMHGHDISQLIGQHLSIFHTKDQMADINRLFDKKHRSDSFTGKEIWHKKEDGTYFPTLTSAHTVHDDQGNPLLVSITVIDITRRLQIEEKLRQHQNELAHAWRVNTMGEMASGLAHELNQPLCAVANYANACQRLLEGRSDISEHITDCLLKIASQTDRAGEIIRRLRSLVSKDTPRGSQFSINSLIEDVLQMENMESQDKGITIHTELPDDLPLLTGDPVQIEQVILNIVRNAFDAMEGTPRDSRRLTIRTSCANDGIEVTISDTGAGLSEEAAKKLFHPFYTTKSKGLGVGLSLSRSLIESHQGRLWAEPNQDGGATFTFTLPLRNKDEQ